MKQPVSFRVVVSKPPAGVTMKVQKGKSELLGPTVVTKDSIAFEFDITVDRGESGLNFLGPFAQGPKDARFVYVNSGTYAGQHPTCWGRRAKLSLMSITDEQISDALDVTGARIETQIPGTGTDGGPICASVKGLEWKVVRK